MSVDNKGVYKLEALLDLGQARGDEDLSHEVFEAFTERGLKAMAGTAPFKEGVAVLTAKVSPWEAPKPPGVDRGKRLPSAPVWEHCATREPFVSSDDAWLPPPPKGDPSSWELVQVLRDEAKGGVRCFWKRRLP